MTKKRKDYTQEFRDSAVKLITEQGYKISEAARNLGISVSVLGRWKRELEAGSGSISSRSAQRNDNVQAELVKLRKENQRLRMEREILKKAAAFFASELGCGIK
jgi:transposase